MEHPSKQDFDDWLACAKSSLPDAIPPDHWSIQLPSDDEMLNFALGMREPFRQYLAQLSRLPAWDWLNSKSEFSRADRLVFSSKRRKRADQPDMTPDATTAAQARVAVWRRSYTRMFGSTVISPGDVPLFVKRRDAVAKLIGSSFNYSHSWDYKLMQALAEYYYGDSCERSIRAAKTLTKQLESLKAAAKLLRSTLATIDEIANTTKSYRNSQRALFIERRAAELASESNYLHAQIPIARNDPHAREKLFVHRMCRANLTMSGSAKSDAIYELMWLPGFKHQYERRHVERLCAEFTGKKRAENAT